MVLSAARHRYESTKVAVIASFPGAENAEHEFQMRMSRLNGHLGCEFILCDYRGRLLNWDGTAKRSLVSAGDIDFAISTHFRYPKSFNVPHFYLNWNPPSFFHYFDFDASIGNIATHDYYVPFGAPKLDAAVKVLLPAEKQGRWLQCSLPPTCNRQASGPLNRNRRLFYCGINWEKIAKGDNRYDTFLNKLADRVPLSIYGPEKFNDVALWDDVPAYVSMLPFDGSSLVRELQNFEACLILLSADHAEYDCASMRLYEAISAGTELICPRMPYLESILGSNAHYFDLSSDDDERILEISKIFDSIAHGEKKLSSAFQQQFETTLCLEHRVSQFLTEALSVSNTRDHMVQRLRRFCVRGVRGKRIRSD